MKNFKAHKRPDVLDELLCLEKKEDMDKEKIKQLIMDLKQLNPKRNKYVQQTIEELESMLKEK